MGYEVNAALGVKLAQPQTEVYSLVGDGSFMMLHSELVTSLQERAEDQRCTARQYGQRLHQQPADWPRYGQLRHRVSLSLSGERAAAGRPGAGRFRHYCAGYGCKTWRVTTLNELRQALDAARRETISTLIDIKVLPKTMVHSYGSWWNVGVAQTALSERIRKVAEMINEKRAEARDY